MPNHSSLSRTLVRLPRLIGLLLLAASARAQTYEVLHGFGYGQNYLGGGLLRTADGKLYGTTLLGGAFGRGSVFALIPDGNGGYAYSVLHEFRGPDGAEPGSALLLASNGSLYGTTGAGGAFEYGTVYRIDRGDRLTTLHSFDGTDGAGPSGSLIQATDGHFYGLTFTGGGPANGGTFYRMDEDGNVTRVHAFEPPEGMHPRDEPVEGTDGAFYGVTSDGGNDFYDAGTVFRVDASGKLTTLHEFGYFDGANPYGGLVVAADGNLYGTTITGMGNSGTLFRIDALGLTVLHEFDSSEGGSRSHLLRGSDGFLYGTNASYPGGSVYRTDLAGVVTTVKAFGFGDGAIASALLIEDPEGQFLAVGSAPNGHGSVMRITETGTVTTLHEFLGRDGFYPMGTLLQASDGKIYGITNGGGDDNSGIVYRADPSGLFEIIKEFSDADGGNQGWGPMQADDGNIYGTTTSGAYRGTAYRLGLDGSFETLHSFTGGDGGEGPASGLTQTPSGDFLGVSYGGTHLFGLLYRMDLQGGVTPIINFPGSPEGAYPHDELTLASDGNFYGVAGGGPDPGYGIVYRFDGDHTVTTVHEFDGIQGSAPVGRLLEASDGKLYGAAAGMLFRVDTSGSFEPFRIFPAVPGEGEGPLGGLIESNGHLYGTTAYGGALGHGTVFRTDLAGSVETLKSFDGDAEGLTPGGPLLRGSDGDFYGTALYGGSAGYGVLFRYSFNTYDPSFVLITPTSGRAKGGASVALSGSHLRPSSAVSFGTAPALSVTARDVSTIFAMTPALTAGMLYDVGVASAGAATATLPNAWFADFLDVPSFHPVHDFVESIVRAGITAGCGGGNYCVGLPVTRSHIAVFLLKAEHGSAYAPPACAGVFHDVPCPSPFADWIEQLAAEGVTAGCAGGNYCPGNPVTRAQMAIFLLKTLLGSSYTPPDAVGIFSDVPVGSFGADWIEDLYGRGITGGCSASPLLYCPNNSNTRGQIAVFLVKTFGL